MRYPFHPLFSFALALMACASGIGPVFAQAPAPPPVAPVLPTDVTNPLGLGAFSGVPLTPRGMAPLNPGDALKRLSPKDFPAGGENQNKEASANADLEGKILTGDGGILLRAKSGSDYSRPAYDNIDLNEGMLFVSVRKPARLAFINTPHAVVALYCEGEGLVSFRNGILRVTNLSAIGQRMRIKIHEATVSATVNGTSYGDNRTEGIVMALKLGHEMVAADFALTKSVLRPGDGIGRRRSVLFENDREAVSEISLESALNNCALLTALRNDDQSVDANREKKIFRDLAKMAAVLNYENGQGGFDGQAQ